MCPCTPMTALTSPWRSSSSKQASFITLLALSHLICTVYPPSKPLYPRLHPRLSLSIPLYPPPSLSIPLYPPLSPSIPLYPSLSLSIPLYPSLSPSIPLCPSLSLSIPLYTPCIQRMDSRLQQTHSTLQTILRACFNMHTNGGLCSVWVVFVGI